MRIRPASRDTAFEFSRLQPFTSGGEARLYRWPDDPDLVAKIYHEPTAERAEKLRAMIQSPPEDPSAHTGRRALAWPIDLLVADYDPESVVGFLMPNVPEARPLVDIYNPGSRRRVCPAFHYRYLMTAARNLAALVHAVHARGYVIADLRETNLLVGADATVTLVDVDSFQVDAGGHILRCPVGTPDYTAPELHGSDFSSIDRLPQHDSFALAVLIYQLLMEGAHPFDGVFAAAGEAPPRDQRIRDGHFPHGARGGPIRPAPAAVPFSVLPPPLRALFARCFDAGHTDPIQRPMAATWRDALRDADHDLVTCHGNPNHIYPMHVTRCPWCARSSMLGGRDPFPSAEVILSGAHLVRPARAPTLRPKPAVVSGGSPRPAARPSQPTQPPTRPLPTMKVTVPPTLPLAEGGALTHDPDYTDLPEPTNPFVGPALTAASLAALMAWNEVSLILLVPCVLLAVLLAVGGLQRARLLRGAGRLATAAALFAALASGVYPAWQARVAAAAPPTGGPVPANPAAPAAVIRRVNPKDGAEMVYIPAGEFVMGPGSWLALHRPAHTVYLDACWVYRRPVTVAQFRRFAAATGRQMPAYIGEAPRDDSPVADVQWSAARDYSRWAGGALPTEAQWDRAAHGAGGGGAACTNRRGSAHLLAGPPTHIPAGPYGAEDMAGPIREWCADWFQADQADRATGPRRNPRGPATGAEHVLRGGQGDCCRVTSHADHDGADDFDDHGFRCALPAAPGDPRP